MTIVRELVTKLSFQVDRRGIENFNRSILGLKTKIALATSVVGGFVAGITKAASAASDAILETSDLAKTIGASTADLNALQRSVSTFRIPRERFVAGVKALSDEIINAEQGFGNLFQLARDGAIKIRDSSGQMLPTLEILMNVLQAIRNIKDERFGRRLAENVLGDPNFYDVAQNIDKLKELNDEFRKTSEAIQQAEEDARRFDREFSKLSETFKEFATILLLPFVKELGTFFKESNETIRSIQKGTLNEKIEADIRRNLNDDGSLRIPIQENLNSMLEPVSRVFNFRNTVNVTVPPGTEESQAQFLRKSAEEVFSETFEKGFQNIGDNFPETE